MNKDLVYWLWLSSKTDLSLKARHALYSSGISAKDVYLSAGEALSKASELTERDVDILSDFSIDRASEIQDNCRKQGLNVLTPDDEEYPDCFFDVYAPPPAIYVKGTLPELENYPVISVIGTRKASEYGIKTAKKLAYELSKCGGIVESGLTAGIDASAADGCLQADGTCISVLGLSHEAFSSRRTKEICERGCLISEYPPGTKNYKAFFRARNRLSAALCDAVIVVEAPEKSGTMLYVSDALDLGKDVYAVPGNIYSENSAGIIKLLKEGATPVFSAWDVLSAYENTYPDKVFQSDSKYEEYTGASRKVYGEKVSKKSTGTVNGTADIDNRNKRDYDDRPVVPEDLSAEQKTVFSCIMNGASLSDDIIEASGIPASKVLSCLTMLQIKRYIKKESGNRYYLL